MGASASQLHPPRGRPVSDRGAPRDRRGLDEGQRIVAVAGRVIGVGLRSVAAPGQQGLALGGDVDDQTVHVTENIFPTRPGWFEAMDAGLRRALEITEAREDSPLRRYLALRKEREAERRPAGG